MNVDRPAAAPTPAEQEKPTLTTGGSAAEERVRAAEEEEGRGPKRAGSSRDRP